MSFSGMVAAIIPTHNRRQELSRCLEALSGQSVQPLAIYVVDNASTDDTEVMIREQWAGSVKFRRSCVNSGAAGGFCDAITWAIADGFDWIWLTDNDSMPQHDSLEKLLQEAQSRPDGVVFVPRKESERGELWIGEMVYDGANGRYSAASPEFYRDGQVFECAWAPNTGMLVRRSAIEKAGLPLAELFAWGEDTEWCIRLGRVGKVYVVPSSVVMHPNPGLPWPVPKPLLWKFYYRHRNSVYLSHKKLIPPHQDLPRICALTVRQAAVTLMRLDHKWTRLRFLLVATWHGLTGTLGPGPIWIYRAWALSLVSPLNSALTNTPRLATRRTGPLYCGFAMLNDVLSEGWAAQVRALLNLPAGPPRTQGWDRHWARVWEFPWAYQVMCRFLAMSGHPNKILESGCGVTPVPFWFGADGHQVTGLDLDESCSSEWAKGSAVCGFADGQVRFERGDMEALPFADASFDGVYSISALEHTRRPAKAVVEMCRVTRGGGLVLLTCDVDVLDSDSLQQEQLDEIQAVLQTETQPFLPFRGVSPAALLTFENRSILPPGATRLALKSALHSLGLKSRTNQCIFAYAGVKRGAKAEDQAAWTGD